MRSSSSRPNVSIAAIVTPPTLKVSRDRLAPMRDERCDAEVILDVVFDRGLLFLVVANTRRPAGARVRIKFDKPFCGVGGTKKMQRLALFRRLEFLAPHKSITVFLDRSASYFARGRADAAHRRGLLADARRASGAASTIHHDLEIYRDLGFIEREVPRAGQA